MKREYINVNTNKLHDELIKSGVMPVLVESFEDKTWITFRNDTDMELAQQIIDSHDPTQLSTMPSEKERIDMLENIILMMMEV